MNFLMWVDELLTNSTNLVLKVRAMEIRLAIKYYERGDYAGGIAEARAFLNTVQRAVDASPSLLNEVTNAEICVIITRLAEWLYTEVSTATDFNESLVLLRSWSPLNPDHPSIKERFADGIRSRILGKLFKDHGDWKESELQFNIYFSKFVVHNSPEEGWAAGDLAHCLMEMSREKDAEKVLVKYLTPRHTIGIIKDHARDRRSDTMYLEMLLGECLLLQKHYEEAEKRLQELLSRFNTFDSLLYFEKYRYFFILTALARRYHMTQHFSLALEYWNQALKYCFEDLDAESQKGKWGLDALFPNIVRLSISDCYFELGYEEQSLQLQQEAHKTINKCDPTPWVLGLGTYWLRWIDSKVAARG
jgi:tetratricopeptide (TPR) repeat protein